MANGGNNGVSIGGGRQIKDLQNTSNGAGVSSRTAIPINSLLPKNGEWVNQMTGNLNKSAGLRKLAATADVSIDVPVRQSDTQWDIVQRSLPLLAKRSGLGAESQKVFAEKWAARLEASGEAAIYDNAGCRKRRHRRQPDRRDGQSRPPRSRLRQPRSRVAL